MTLRELYELFDGFNRANRTPGTAGFYRFNLLPLVRQFGGLAASQFRPLHLLQFRSTWHRILSVQRLYTWAQEQELVSVNPFARLKRPRLGSRRRVLNRVDLARLLRRAGGEFRSFLIAARETAARPQELRELTWQELQLPDRTSLEEALPAGTCCFVVAEFKARRRRADTAAYRVIPVSPRLGRLMLRIARRQGTAGRVFCRQGARPWSYGQLRGRMDRLRKRSGLPLAVHGERISCYTLRHSSATAWAARGLQASVLQSLLGHANIRTTQRYVHLSKEQLIAAWRAFHGKQK